MTHRLKTFTITLLLLLLAIDTCGKTGNRVVADSVTRMPLSGASLFDSRGSAIGTCSLSGTMPHIPADKYPVTVRYIGFKEKVIAASGADTIFLSENQINLPEVVVESRQHKVLHILAYVREYSTLATYLDTVFMFREKMVDYMLTPDRKMRFKGWTTPRVLKSRSYYRFTDAGGLDSVSDKCSHHFSWADWIGIVPTTEITPRLADRKHGSDTIRGKYRPAEVWTRKEDRLAIDVNVLSDTSSRKWVPNLSSFFKDNLDFESFRVRFDFDNVVGHTVGPMELTEFSFDIASNGRGYKTFIFDRVGRPFFVNTYAEVYILDKEYITVKEAKKWERNSFESGNIDIYEPAQAPPLQPAVMALVDRVEHIDRDKVRLGIVPDRRLAGRKAPKQHMGQRVLQLLKTMTGISSAKANRNWKRGWRDFTREQIDRNKNEE